MGSYDLAGQLFADRLQRPLHIVRVPERHAESQTYAADARHSHPSGQFIVHYNQPGNMLAVELTRLLADGEVVAIQGDRILFDVAPENLDFCEGYQWRLPKGPFLLGVVSRCPVFPLFIARVGWRRYRITAGPPFECPEGRFDKNDWRQRMASWWSTQLAAAVRTHWRQWFVFEPAFVAKPEPTP